MSDNPMNFFARVIGPQETDPPATKAEFEPADLAIGHTQMPKPSRYYDETLVTLTSGNPEETFYLSGFLHHPEGYKFSGKIFDIGSIYGILDGRISKLSIQNPFGKTEVHYERGWSELPQTAQAMEALETILKAFRSFEELSKSTP